MFTRRENAIAQMQREIENDRREKKKQTEMTWTDVKDRRGITLNCAGDREFDERSSRIESYHRELDGKSNCRLRREMRANQQTHHENIIPFRKRSGDGRHRVDDAQSDNILRMLDLSKFERDRRAVENGTSMRSNIAAIVLLGLLVFIATEDFYRLEQSNLCMNQSECRN
jgi:hypothetical protein